MLRILLMPVWAFLVMIQWIGTFLFAFTALLFYILAMLFYTGALLYGIMKLASLGVTATLVGAGTVFFMIPRLCGWLVSLVVNLREWIREYIAS